MVYSLHSRRKGFRTGDTSCLLLRVQVLAEFCAQDEDGQTPLLFAARSGSGAVFRQALEALLARATPQKVSPVPCFNSTTRVHHEVETARLVAKWLVRSVPEDAISLEPDRINRMRADSVTGLHLRLRFFGEAPCLYSVGARLIR